MQYLPKKLVASNDGNIMRYTSRCPSTPPALCYRLRSGTAELPWLIACHFNKPFFQLACLEGVAWQKSEHRRGEGLGCAKNEQMQCKNAHSLGQKAKRL